MYSSSRVSAPLFAEISAALTCHSAVTRGKIRASCVGYRWVALDGPLGMSFSDFPLPPSSSRTKVRNHLNASDDLRVTLSKMEPSLQSMIMNKQQQCH
ncbi:hypothetical protein ANTQUA_LOCUS3896 [Anthophora quadrimaculata]